MPTPATSATLVWNANPAADLVTKYLVYERLTDGTYSQLAEVQATAEPTYIVSGLTPGAHTYAVTSVNLNSESERSNDATMPGQPSAPTNLTITINIVINP